MSKLETGSTLQTMIKKDTLKCLTSIGQKNTDLPKLFNFSRILVARRIKFHGLTNVLRETEDDNDIIQMLCEVHQFRQNDGQRCAVGNVLTKHVKVMEVRLRLVLKILKIHNLFQWK